MTSALGWFIWCCGSGSVARCLPFADRDGAGGPFVATSRSGSLSGLGLNLRTLLCAGRLGVRTGVFSRSSGSTTDRPLAIAKTSTPLLRLGEPLMPVFRGDADRGGGIEAPRSDLRVDRIWVGVRPVPTASLKSAPEIAHWIDHPGEKI
jgi:hypothetical protein